MPNKTEITSKKAIDNVNEKKDLNLEDSNIEKRIAGKKLTDSHIECFKTYLKENSSITIAESMDRIAKDTGLKISYSLVQKTLLKLKKELGLVPNTDNLIKTGAKKFPYGYKFKNVHIEYLEKYLEEDKFIAPIEAKDRIVKDTGLEVSYSLVQKILQKLKKKLDLESDDKNSINAGTSISHFGNKLKNKHIECIKSYLKENKYITLAQTKSRLHKETGLNISLSTIGKVMTILREELSPEYTNLDLVKVDNNRFSPKLNDGYMEYLKKYLKEDAYIGNTEAMNKLYQDTGLKISVTKIRHALIKLEEEIINEEGELSSSDSISKSVSEPWAYGLKLKKLHIEYLKEYISENSIISAKKAARRLRDETGLELSGSTIRKALTILKNSNQGFNEPPLHVSPSKVRSRPGNYNFKLQDQHIECLKRYLNENNCVNLNEVKKKLYNETGLKVTNITIKNAFLELKGQTDPDKNQSISDAKIKFKQWNFGRKLKDNHIECLKKYLNEDNSIGSTKAKNRLYDDTGLEISAHPIQLALAKLRKEMCQAGNEKQLHTTILCAKAKVNEFGYKVKDLHIECLKKYLIEDESINCEVAMNRLIQDTGLKLSKTTIHKILSNLKVKTEP
jgi:uncharacterized protein YneF (UPF0154 family)